MTLRSDPPAGPAEVGWLPACQRLVRPLTEGAAVRPRGTS
jgi:hypothetical protein